jgi:ABC-2 type transport system permease protein
LGSLYRLVQNETLKTWRKKRFQIVLILLTVIIPIFTYAQMRVVENMREQMGTNDWRIVVQQQIQDYTNRVSSPRVPEEWKQVLRVSIQKLNYHLEQNIDPARPNAVTFTSQFIDNAVNLFLPLMVMVIAADLVSAERVSGTIKLLLARPVRRWKVLFSKYIAMLIYTSLIVFATILLCYLISGLAFGYGGWLMPVMVGFKLVGEEVFTDQVRVIEHWQYLLMQAGLVWFSCVVVGCISLMLSVLVRGIAAGMGIMLAMLIAGTILVNMVSAWESAKYFFMVNLRTTLYLSGSMPPVPGMTLPFSLAVLTVWAALSVLVSFLVFTRQDIYS